MKMKKRIIASTAVLAASVMLCAVNVDAEITDPGDYMGEWYANYMMDGQDGMRMNVAGIMGASYVFTLNEDGTGTVVYSGLEDDATEEPENVAFNWEYTDGKIVLKVEDGSEAAMDDVDGELLIDMGDDTLFVLGRELIQEEMDWDALIGAMADDENIEKANTPKENPYVYHPEAPNTKDVISAYMENYSYREFEIAIDEANGTFTVDFQGDEYSESEHIEGTYEITADNFVNIKWVYDEEYGLENVYEGAEYVERWNTYTVKEDLSNVPDVIAAMADSMDYEHQYTADSVTLTETSDTEGTAVLKDGDYEFTYDYSIVPGVDPILSISYYDEEQEYTPEWDNYNMR